MVGHTGICSAYRESCKKTIDECVKDNGNRNMSKFVGFDLQKTSFRNHMISVDVRHAGIFPQGEI